MIARRLLTRTGTALTLLCLMSALPGSAHADVAAPIPQIMHVGPHQTIKTIADAERLARAGATIDVDSGTYAGDVAVWTRANITLRAVGGRVRLLANGAAAEGKGILVVRAHGMRVEGFDFEGAKVPGADAMGAVNNRLAGMGTLESAGPGEYSGNTHIDLPQDRRPP